MLRQTSAKCVAEVFSFKLNKRPPMLRQGEVAKTANVRHRQCIYIHGGVAEVLMFGCFDPTFIR